MEWQYTARHLVIPKLARFQNPIAYLRDYSKRRGMEYITDVRDWLGGYPFEDASIGEVVRFSHQELGLTLTNITASTSFGEFLFQKPR